MTAVLTRDNALVLPQEAPTAATTLPTKEEPSSRLGHLVTTLALLVLLDLGVGFPGLLAARVIALTLVVILPGALALAAGRVRFISRYAQVAAIVATGLFVIMALVGHRQCAVASGGLRQTPFSRRLGHSHQPHRRLPGAVVPAQR